MKSKASGAEHIHPVLCFPDGRSRKGKDGQLLSCPRMRIGHRIAFLVDHADQVRTGHIHFAVPVSHKIFIFILDPVTFSFIISGSAQMDLSQDKCAFLLIECLGHLSGKQNLSIHGFTDFFRHVFSFFSGKS